VRSWGGVSPRAARPLGFPRSLAPRLRDTRPGLCCARLLPGSQSSTADPRPVCAGRVGAHRAAAFQTPARARPGGLGGRGRQSSPTRTTGPAASAGSGAAWRAWTRRLGSTQPVSPSSYPATIPAQRLRSVICTFPSPSSSGWRLMRAAIPRVGVSSVVLLPLGETETKRSYLP
jgi:hypothetical protein